MKRGLRRRLRGLGLGVALLLAAAALEVGVRAWHDPRDADFFFDRYFFDARLARALSAPAPTGPVDRVPEGQLPINTEGYRGIFSLRDPPRPGRARVVATGAGHLFAQDVAWGEAWTERVEAALREDGVDAEVWNLAVPGSTILFMERGQLDAIVAAQPDVVVLGHGGFNEALFAGIPERAVLHPDAVLPNLLLSSLVVRLSVLRGSRWWRSMRGEAPLHKVEVGELEAALGRSIGRLRAAGVQPVLVQQVVVNPDIPGVWALADMGPYRAAVARVARSENVPLVDPFVAFEPPLERWFADQEYYTSDAHGAIAGQLGPLLAALLGREPPPASHQSAAPP